MISIAIAYLICGRLQNLDFTIASILKFKGPIQDCHDLATSLKVKESTKFKFLTELLFSKTIFSCKGVP